ncbi:efflux RND transporter permease subunit [Fretibacter rubidus]|uniref:efflux RND transporter permease subunit n=1 Tax=Fretibacter rubidus TaxID=570162 RepID=UPI00352A9D89
MHRIVGFAIDNWRMTMGLMLFAVFGGIVAMGRLALDAEPDIPVPFINVRVVLPGVSPEDAQRLLIRPMESELKSIEGLKQMDGVAANSVAYMILEFNASFDQDKAIQDVIEKVDKARSEFPQEAREPIIEEINTSTLPIVVVNLFGAAPERELQRRAKMLQRRIESLPEVLEANISGERTDVLEAELDPALIESSGITFDEIAAAVSRNNSLITAGVLETESGKFNVKLPGLIEKPEDLADLVIRSSADGASIIRMSDVSRVRRTYKDPGTYARFDGQTSVSIEVSKRQGQNILDTTAKVQALVDEIAADDSWPDTILVAYSQERKTYILDMVSSLSSSIINAVVLVFIVCIAALGIRSALFVGWAVPASFLMSLFLFWVNGETINMMILFGLILSVGVLVDSAIVIIEFADRKLAEGMDRKEAFKTAGERMFWPIISSTATTLAAFIPLLFWDSVTGKFMSYFPLTMIYVLTASMFMAIIFLPTMGTLIGPKKLDVPDEKMLALSGDGGDPLATTGITGVYVRFIHKIIRFPLLVIAVTGLLLFLIVVFFRSSVAGPPPKPVEFFTQSPSDQVYILARARGNTTPLNQLDIGLELERRIANVTGVESVYTVAGAGAGGSGGGGDALSGPSNVPSDTVVRLYTELLPFDERPSVVSIMDELRNVTSDIPGVITEVTATDNGPPIGKSIGLQISSDDPIALRATTKMMREKLEATEGVIEVEDTLPLPGVEWELDVDRAEAGRLGLDVGRIGAAVQLVTEGTLVGQYRPLDADEEVDIRIRYPSEARGLDNLDRLRIQTRDGSVPLSTVVTRVAKTRQDTIDRRDQLPYYEVLANAAKDYAPNVLVEDLRNWIKNDADIPESVQIKFLGQEEENAAAAEFFQMAGLAIMLMMGIILLLQFNSFYHVFLTLFAVVLSVFGVLLGLSFYPYISMILTGTGVIALAGIVVNNNIVLIDTYQRLMTLGYGSVDAATRTAAQRLRPVFLTTLTTVVGLMPLVLGWDADIFSGEFSTKGSATSDIWAPISYAIACGLGFATLLTLIITPVMLAAPKVLMERFNRYVRNDGKKTAYLKSKLGLGAKQPAE